MKNREFWIQIIAFVISLLAILFTREFISYQLIQNGIESYRIHISISIVANLVLILVSYFFIKKNGLYKIAGIKSTRLQKWYLLIFPLVYLVLLNALFLDDLNTDLLFPNIGFLFIYALSIGISEELNIRGFLQSHLINRFGNTKKNIVLSVIATSFFFGILHLINFNKGLYGELSQVCFATFIGVMFGALLIITKRIYPLIIIHSIIDFVAKLDSTGVPIKQKVSEPTSIENAALSMLLVLPCLIYGLFLMKRYKLIDQTTV
ncbi:MAG: CPBP family intramembrane metalloprotease [Flavobacterium sp.]|nr:CPBP family intramembrane metalloprotease [Flavobacterium sp.]